MNFGFWFLKTSTFDLFSGFLFSHFLLLPS